MARKSYQWNYSFCQISSSLPRYFCSCLSSTSTYYIEYRGVDNVTLEEAAAIMGPFECFANENGEVNAREMALCLLLVAPGAPSDSFARRIEAIFQVIDEDNSGDLSKDGIMFRPFFLYYLAI